MTGILGAILAGGQSRRFGSDKALATLDGRKLIEHAIQGLAAQVDQLVIIGRVEETGGITAIPDRPAPGLGPLGGLNAALHHAREHGFEAVVTIGCDMPVLPPDFVTRLRAAGCPSFFEAVPIIGLWPSDLADRLDARLASGTERSVRGWARTVGAVAVAGAAELPNVNTPADLAALAEGQSLAAVPHPVHRRDE